MFYKLSIKARLFLLTAISLLSLGAVAYVLMSALSVSRHYTEIMFKEASEPAIYLGGAHGTIGKILADLILAQQHAPNSEHASLHHDHPIEAHFESAEMWKKAFEDNFSKAKALLTREDEKKRADRLQELYNKFLVDVYQPVTQELRVKNGKYDTDVMALIIGNFMTIAKPLEEGMKELLDMQAKVAAKDYDDSEELYSRHKRIIALEIGVILAILLALTIAIEYSIIKPMNHLSNAMRMIVQTNDFTGRIDAQGRDETAQAAQSFNQLLEALQTTFKDLHGFVTQFDRASEELAALSDKVAKASTNTSDSSSDMAASVEEMTASIATVGENARETNKNAEVSMSLSVSGSEIVHKTIAEMQKMSQAVESSSETIGELGKQSEQISGIVQTIKD
ncbi:MAG: methyl-accepting chemotaxis protein, partial [Helicobacteraceae bacterium]|nr:methyl-accepting chemotaxis protein [Helicobacteraceae bacterium]